MTSASEIWRRVARLEDPPPRKKRKLTRKERRLRMQQRIAHPELSPKTRELYGLDPWKGPGR